MPKYTIEEWVIRIKDVIRAAERDGYMVGGTSEADAPALDIWPRDENFPDGSLLIEW